MYIKNWGWYAVYTKTFCQGGRGKPVYQKRGMPSRLVDRQWLYCELVHALRSKNELNKTEHRNAVMGCGTCCNVI
jgi:hypothetical protein